jgi:hypothetical protein
MQDECHRGSIEVTSVSWAIFNKAGILVRSFAYPASRVRPFLVTLVWFLECGVSELEILVRHLPFWRC